MKTTKTIAHIALPKTNIGHFDYRLAPDLQSDALIGARVNVLFRKKYLTGLCVGFSDHSNVPAAKLQPIQSLVDKTFIFPKEIIELCRWVSEYYHCTLGEALFTAMPKWLREGRALALKKDPCWPIVSYDSPANLLTLNSEQQIAFDEIKKNTEQFSCFLLDGVTGSGKTEVYCHAMHEVLKKKKNILILVPEIGLTPQLLSRLEKKFNAQFSVLHSGLNKTQRFNGWFKSYSGKSNIIIGTRSAVFTPIPNLGLIVIDEEHDTSFKQQEGIRYSARDIAIVRAKNLKIPIILGSATPSLETLSNAHQNKYTHLILTHRAANASPPKMHCIDMRPEKSGQAVSTLLIKEINKRLELNQQVLIFINRRGYAPAFICQSCSWIADCKQCDARLTCHLSNNTLRCHHCGFTQRKPTQCPKCHARSVYPVGFGTERIEENLKKCFPDANLLRIDRDTTSRKGELAKKLKLINDNKVDILIGTQMLAKGHHFPKVTLVGVLNADSGLASIDFRASERLGQLLLQVAGRAGRAELCGEVLIQSHMPDHPLMQLLLKQNYNLFSAELLKQRQAALLPPFSFLTLIRAKSKNKEKCQEFLKNLYQSLEQLNLNLLLLGPVPAPMAFKANDHRFQLLIQAQSRKTRHRALNTLLNNLKSPNGISFSVDVDPIDLV